MIRQIFLSVFLAIGLCACSTPSGLFNMEHFGHTQWAGGEFQLFFSNPEYNSDDQLKDETRMKEIFGKKSGNPVVVGGIGAMQIWKF